MKRLFLVFFFVTISIIAFAVDNLFTGATNSNWNTATNWSQGTIPTATDGYVTLFDATSPNCTLSTTIGVCNYLSFANYTNTITLNIACRISGNTTFGANMIIAGTASFNLRTSATITCNGKLIPYIIFDGVTATFTLSDNLITTNVTINANNQTYNGNAIYVGGSLSNVASSTTQGTTNIILNGTGTWSNTSAGYLKNNVTINTAGTITLGTNVYYSTGTLTYTAGTIVNTGSTLNVGTCTLNMAGATLNNLAITVASANVSLSSEVKIAGQLSSSVTGSIIKSNSAGTQRKLTLLATGTTSISATNNIDATDINSGDGLPIVSEGAILNNTLNWYSSAGTLTNMFFAY